MCSATPKPPCGYKTLDNGEPISTYTVAREVGHTDTKMIERVYGHLLKDRRRLPEVRYRRWSLSQRRAGYRKE